jgi:hypothetical protein
MATGLERTAVSPHTMQAGQVAPQRPSLAQTAMSPLTRAYQAYQQYVGQPFQQIVRGGARGYFGLPLMEDANALGRSAYGQGVALSNVPSIGAPAGAFKVAAHGIQALPSIAGDIGRVISGMPSGAAARQAEDFAAYQRSIPPSDVSRMAQLEKAPDFANWFANSKVADPAGNPIVMYHGTTKEISTLKPSDLGVHVGTVDQAQSRINYHGEKGGNVMPLYVSIKNPLRLNDSPSWKDPMYYIDKTGIANYLSKELVGALKNIPFVYKEIIRKNNGKNDEVAQKQMEAVADFYNKKVVDELKAQGYDGIVYSNTHDGTSLSNKMRGDDSYIAFSPDQIRSVFSKD